MKLTTARVERTLQGFDAQVIPDNPPVVPQLSHLFGEHTFFLNANGLHIVEPVEAAPEVEGPQAGQVIELAAWTDESRTSLAPHEPAPTEVVVNLDGEASPGSRH
jgi:hypothetical protein